jgi:hypothetical protein
MERNMTQAQKRVIEVQSNNDKANLLQNGAEI